MRLHLGRGGEEGGWNCFSFRCRFPGKKSGIRRKKGREGEKEDLFAAAFRFIYVQISILPFCFATSKTWNDISRQNDDTRDREREREKRKGNGACFDASADRRTHEERHLHSWKKFGRWRQEAARGCERVVGRGAEEWGEFRPPSGFRQRRKLDRRQVAGQSITEAWLCYWLRRKINADSHFHVNYPRHVGRCRKRRETTDSRCAASFRKRAFLPRPAGKIFVPCNVGSSRASNENMIKLFWLKKKKNFLWPFYLFPSFYEPIELSSLPNETYRWREWRGVDRVIGSWRSAEPPKKNLEYSYRPIQNRVTCL